MTNSYHESVMVKEVLESLHLKTSSQRTKEHLRIVDATLGTGGHTEAISDAGGEVLGIEADPNMIKIAKKRLGNKAKLVLGNFINIKKLTIDNDFTKIDGILFDLGVSNLHLKEDTRGFSFNNPDQELDMRLNPEEQGVKASDLLNALDQTQLTQLFGKVVSHNEAKRIAGRIMTERPIHTVSELIEALKNIPHKEKLNPATLPMLALRIAVNSELDNLREVLPTAFSLLKPKGRLLVITFHSGEEEIVKEFMKERVKIRLPSSEEIFKNIRSRSAKLYVYEKN